MSELRANTISDAAGTGPVTLTGQYAAKAWVNFNGTGTVAIRQSGNVSSITDNGTGDYTVNFTTAVPTTDYVVSLSGEHNSGVVLGFSGFVSSSSTATATQVVSINANGAAFDNSHMRVAVFC